MHTNKQTSKLHLQIQFLNWILSFPIEWKKKKRNQKAFKTNTRSIMCYFTKIHLMTQLHFFILGLFIFQTI